MTGRVVGVHGIGNTQRGKTPAEAAAVLGHRWTAALRQGLGQQHGVEAVVAYYAHQLATDTPQGAGDPEPLREPEQQMLGAGHAVISCRGGLGRLQSGR